MVSNKKPKCQTICKDSKPIKKTMHEERSLHTSGDTRLREQRESNYRGSINEVQVWTFRLKITGEHGPLESKGGE